MDNCLFCKIARGEIPAKIVHQDESTVVFADINPKAPVHLLAIPRAHYAAIHEVPASELGVIQKLFETVNAVVAAERLLDAGYRLVVNCGEKAGQTVPHIHVHIFGGRAMQWPPG